MKKKWKIKTFLVATNVVASRPPERRPTATPTARANSFFSSEISTGILKNDFSRMDSQLGKLFCEFHRFPVLQFATNFESTSQSRRELNINKSYARLGEQDFYFNFEELSVTCCGNYN